MKTRDSQQQTPTRALIDYCPRCRHAVRFQQAASDHAWVCQKCLRYRIAAIQAERTHAGHIRDQSRAL